MFLHRKHMFLRQKLMFSDRKHKLSHCKNTFFSPFHKINLMFFVLLTSSKIFPPPNLGGVRGGLRSAVPLAIRGTQEQRLLPASLP